MSYSGVLVKINNTTIPNLVEFKVGRNKLWKNADRNMNGDVRATLIGIFPKLSLKIGICTENQISTLTELLDQSFFTVTYFDVREQETVTASYYASDYEIDILNKQKGLYKPFDVNLIPVSKRRY